MIAGKVLSLDCKIKYSQPMTGSIFYNLQFGNLFFFGRLCNLHLKGGCHTKNTPSDGINNNAVYLW